MVKGRLWRFSQNKMCKCCCWFAETNARDANYKIVCFSRRTDNNVVWNGSVVYSILHTS